MADRWLRDEEEEAAGESGVSSTAQHAKQTQSWSTKARDTTEIIVLRPCLHIALAELVAVAYFTFSACPE